MTAALAAWSAWPTRRSFVAPLPLQRTKISHTALRAEEGENDVEVEEWDYHPWEASETIVTIGNSSNPVAVARAASIRLLKLGEANVECAGDRGVFQAMRTAQILSKWNANTYSKIGGSLAVRPEIVIRERADGDPSFIMRIHVAPVIRPEPLPEILEDEVLKASSSNEAISKTATLIQIKVKEEGVAKIRAVGSTSVNRMMKAVFRANQGIVSRNASAEVLWGLLSEEQILGAGGDMLNTTTLHLVLAPQ